MTQQVTKNITVNGNVSHIYNIWANFEQFPHFMKYITSVTLTAPRTSHWVMEGPLGFKVDWYAEMTRLDENKRIGWNSKDASGMITTSGQVIFTQLSDNETDVAVTVQYAPPAGKAGELVAKLFANPEQRLEEDLRNFKRLMEVGEIPTIEGQPRGKCR